MIVKATATTVLENLKFLTLKSPGKNAHEKVWEPDSCSPRSIAFDLIKPGNFKPEENTLACRPVPGACTSAVFSQNWWEIGLQGNLVAKVAKHFGHSI